MCGCGGIVRTQIIGRLSPYLFMRYVKSHLSQYYIAIEFFGPFPHPSIANNYRLFFVLNGVNKPSW